MNTSLSRDDFIFSRMAVNRAWVVFEAVRNDGYSRPSRPITPTNFRVWDVDSGFQQFSIWSVKLIKLIVYN